MVIAVAGLYLLCIKAGFFLQTSESAASDLLRLFCPAHSGDRPFLPAGGWSTYVLHPVSGMRDHWSDPRLFQRYAPLCRRDPQLERRTGLPPRPGSPSSTRGILSCGVGLYPADHRSGGSASRRGFPAHEPGIGLFPSWPDGSSCTRPLSARELGGCALLFAAILLAQVPVGRKRDRRK